MSLTLCLTTGKRVYQSVHAAKRASAKMHNRIRVYWCPECHGMHVANAEKLVRESDRDREAA